jgi:nucleoside-diphosphate-sugar epimerase
MVQFKGTNVAKSQTVLLTGSSGYIAKHIAVRLLNAGYHVVGSVRSLARADEVRDAVTPHLDDTGDLDKRLRFVALDLAQDTGWEQAMQGVDILMHTASPFPLEQPKDENDLIRPAVDGALRALKAANAAGVKRVVMTSSAVAVMEGALPAGKSAYDEDDWSDIDSPTINAYGKSKTMAERAAWDYVADQAPDIALTTINPVLVTGPPLDKNFGASVSIVERVLRAKDPMLPRVGFPFVDVRDVAEMHLRALQHPDSAGQRILAAESSLWFTEMAETLKTNFPNRKIITRQAPNFVVRLLALFDSTIRQIVPNLGKKIEVSNARARSLLKMDFIPARTSVTETATYLVDNNLLD